MKKATKVFLLAAVLFAVLIVGASAKGSGLRLGLEFGNPSAVIIIRPAPFDFKIGYSFWGGSEYLFLSGDYRIVSGYQLIDFLHAFFGVGAYTEIAFGGTSNVTLGGRIPIGLQAFLMNSVIEIFVEAAPTIAFLPSINFAGFQGYIGFTFRL